MHHFYWRDKRNEWRSAYRWPVHPIICVGLFARPSVKSISFEMSGAAGRIKLTIQLKYGIDVNESEVFVIIFINEWNVKRRHWSY